MEEVLAVNNHNFKIIPGFKWRCKDGNSYYVNEMKTSHLFFTLRMIWNHTMPDKAKIEPYKRYVFPPTYTEKYMLTAIRHIFNELIKRDDIDPKHQLQLDLMRSNFYNIVESCKLEHIKFIGVNIR